MCLSWRWTVSFFSETNEHRNDFFGPQWLWSLPVQRLFFYAYYLRQPFSWVGKGSHKTTETLKENSKWLKESWEIKCHCSWHLSSDGKINIWEITLLPNGLFLKIMKLNLFFLRDSAAFPCGWEIERLESDDRTVYLRFANSGCVAYTGMYHRFWMA